MAGNLVAFDIGQYQAKLVWYAGKTEKKAVAAPLPDGLAENGEIRSMDAMADFLKKTARENGIPRAAAAVVLPGRLVFTRIVDVPPMTAAQLAYNLPFEFKDYLTQEKGLYVFDYAVQELVRDETGAVTQMKLFACAALKSTIEKYRAMLRRAGFQLKFAMPEESAFAALVSASASAPEDCCVVDLGHTATRMHVLHAGRFVTRRVAEIGVDDVVQALAETRGVDVHMAQEHLLGDYENALHDPAALELYNRMAVEIMKAVNFYHYNNRDTSLEQVYLCGGGAAIAPLCEAIEQVTQLRVHPVQELMAGSADKTPWLFAKAVGCALQNREGRK